MFAHTKYLIVSFCEGEQFIGFLKSIIVHKHRKITLHSSIKQLISLNVKD